MRMGTQVVAAMLVLGTACDTYEVGSESNELIGASGSGGSLNTDAVVWVSGCTGTLVAQDIVLTADHCVGMAWAGGSSQWDGQWHPAAAGRTATIKIGPDSANPVFTTTASWFNSAPVTPTGGHDDIVLYALDQPVPGTIATPRGVLIEEPSGWQSETHATYGYGDAAQVSRFRTWANTTNFRPAPGQVNQADGDLLAGATGIGGDSGGPTFYGGFNGPVFGVTQQVALGSVFVRPVLTFGTGAGGDKPNLSAWLGAVLYGAADAGPRRMGDYTGDGRADLLCHDRVDGRKWMDDADTLGRFSWTDWTGPGGWCKHESGQLFHGDFDGDGQDDLLCHDAVSGTKWIDYADDAGRFDGTDWSRAGEWCSDDNKRLFIGDFDGDEQDDLLCHDVVSGNKWIDYADDLGRFGGTDWHERNHWCRHTGARLFIRDFNGDEQDDMLCHDMNDGRKWIDFADDSGQFYGTDWSREAAWCNHDSGELHVGDFNGDERDDLLCHDVITGRKWIDFADLIGHFNGSDWSRFSGWCNHIGSRLYIGDFNRDRHDDMLCYDSRNGTKWIDYASGRGEFDGTDWVGSLGWCSHFSAQLL